MTAWEWRAAAVLAVVLGLSVLLVVWGSRTADEALVDV